MQSTENINSSFFSGIYKDVWRNLIPPGLTEAEVDFITEMAALEQEGHVLDIMCGYGRHSLELGRRGYKVTAIDNSTEYIEDVRKAVASEQLPVEAIQGDVATVEFDGKFDAAICMGNSISFFNKKNVIDILSRICFSLKSKGNLIINTDSLAEIVFPQRYIHGKTWSEVGEYKYLMDTQLLFRPTRLDIDHIIIHPDGKSEVLKGIDYIFSMAEIEEMLDEAGFALREVYFTPRKRKFKLGDPHAYIVADKKD